MASGCESRLLQSVIKKASGGMAPGCESRLLQSVIKEGFRWAWLLGVSRGYYSQ